MDMFMDIEGPVLCVAAHPEDLEIHAGGTVARLVEAVAEDAVLLELIELDADRGFPGFPFL